MSSAQNKIQKSMENIKATEVMKQNTLRYLEARRVSQNRSASRQKPHAILQYAVAVICIFFLAGMGGYSVYRRPVSYISIDVNPSIELAVNRFDRVVSVTGYNADGHDILQHVPLKNISYLQAIDRLLQDAYYSRFLSRDSQLVVTVVSEHSDAMLEQIQANDSFQALDALTYSSDTACMKEAHQHEMSFGKYRAFLELAQYDDDITVEDCHGMSMGEIQNRIKTCQGHNGKNTTGGESVKRTPERTFQVTWTSLKRLSQIKIPLVNSPHLPYNRFMVQEVTAYLEQHVMEELRETYGDLFSGHITVLAEALEKIYVRTKKRFVFLIGEWDCVMRER